MQLKKLCIFFSCFLLISSLVPTHLLAKKIVNKANTLFEQGNYNNPQGLKRSLQLYQKALKENPDSYELNWKIARSCREYAKYCKQNKLRGWKNICEKYGKKGMQFAKKAINIRANKVQGHLFYSLCVVSYAEGVGIMSIYYQNLKKKTLEHLNKAYQIDRRYRNALPALALGRFWQMLPLWYDDPDRALELYQEADSLMPKDSDYRPTLQVYMGKLLLEQGINESRAKSMLKKAKNSEDPWLSKRAKKILEKY